MERRISPQFFALKTAIVLAYVSLFLLFIPAPWDFFWFAVGVLCGVAVPLLDEYILCFRYREKAADAFLVSRSPMFILSLIPLSLMVLTSFGSLWASGLVNGIMLFLLLEMTGLRRDPVAFHKRFLSTIKGEASLQNTQFIVFAGWVFFAMMHVLFLF